MTDPVLARLAELEHRAAQHERDLSRAIRITLLRDTGHATKTELAELRAIADRYPRYPAPDG